MNQNNMHAANIQHLHSRFLLLLKNLLEKEGFGAVAIEFKLGNNIADFTALSPKNETITGELKLYRTRKAPVMSVAIAVSNLSQQIKKFQSKKGMLIVTTNLPERYMNSIDFENSLIKIWDLKKLRQKFAQYPDLEQTFTVLLNELQPFQEEFLQIPEAQEISKEKEPQKKETAVDVPAAILSVQNPDVSLEDVSEGIGQKLAAELEIIPPAKPGATSFEVKCREALEYLFKTDLAAWKPQPVTESGLHRFDLIARITSEHEFWRTLQNHFRAKYVIFEFKNYTEEISQKEIYSTEKYLYLPAMRPLAIIISRKGPDENALIAARGSLREHGKVIINISMSELQEMLKKQDAGGVASDYMIAILDEMLMQIER